MTFADRYCNAMVSEKIRQIASLLLALALAIGLVTHDAGGPGMPLASTMAAASDMLMRGDVPMSGKCGGCVGDEKGMPAACSAFCGTVVALPAVAVVLESVPVDILGPAAGQVATGYAVPPDPYPPRSTIRI
jgi:NADPH-dependent ferric siderophore reductase